MSSKKLSTPDDLTSYHDHQAFIRVFKYSPMNQLDHLLCILGDRGQGAKGEVAHLKITEEAYTAIAACYPVEEREQFLRRSEFLLVRKGSGLLVEHVTQTTPTTETV